MIPVEKLRAVRHIITHQFCGDGIASAMILKQVLPQASVTFMQYETDAQRNLKPKEGMLFCDFSPHKSRVAEFKDAGAIVLDHHDSQREVVAEFGELGVYADLKTQPGVSGAVLALQEVWLPLNKDGYDDGVMCTAPTDSERQTVQDIARLAGVRDTWQTKDSDWQRAREQNEALVFWPVEELLGLNPNDWAAKLSVGSSLFDSKLRRAASRIEGGYTFTTDKGRRVLAFEGLSQASDAAELAGDKHDLVVAFGYIVENSKPAVIYSTRSHTDFDCAALALAHGGGGHRPSAGFRIALDPSTPQPYELLRRLLARYEAVEDQWVQTLDEKRRLKEFKLEGLYDAIAAPLAFG